MEAVFEDLGFPPITDKVEFYSQLYKIDVNALYEGFKGSGRTNMELFMEQLRKHCPSCQRRRLPLLETNLDLPATLQWTRIGSIFKTETNAWSEIEIEGFRPPPFRKGRVPHQSSSRSARNNLVAEAGRTPFPWRRLGPCTADAPPAARTSHRASRRRPSLTWPRRAGPSRRDGDRAMNCNDQNEVMAGSPPPGMRFRSGPRIPRRPWGTSP